MSLVRLLTIFATAITKLPDLLRWIGRLFNKSLSEQLAEIELAEAALKQAKDKEAQDAALKKISDTVNRNIH
ncbi:MAG: hypothetical protein EBX40_04325 [Gammaproteobacteria bacterium]|nr:hypothetical protein [Gammaproteobacteria bacterium]